MRTRILVTYAVAGAALGAFGGLAAAASLVLYARHLWGGLALAGASGAVAAGAGAVAATSRKAAARDCGVGFVLACAGYLGAIGVTARLPNDPNAAALAYMLFTVVFSCAVGTSHATSLGRREFRFAAAFFATIAGLIALAAGVRILWTAGAVSFPGAIAAGALYGALLWFAIGVSRRIFSVDVERFRVR